MDESLMFSSRELTFSSGEGVNRAIERRNGKLPMMQGGEKFPLLRTCREAAMT